MKYRLGPFALGGVAALTGALIASNDARACGAFYPQSQDTTRVTAHRMALSISPAQTVLWDQVEYQGSPSEFAWVVPVKPGAHVEVANNAWFEALDAATSTSVASPKLNCPQPAAPSAGCGCETLGVQPDAPGNFNPGNDAPPPVTVVHQGSVGPYETVTLHATVPGSLTTWLTTNGFAIDATVAPIIDAYSSEGFDFIALRLKPDQGVQQMTPVRIVSPGAVPALPLRMVAAGTGPEVDVTLFVIGEGRWEPKNFPSVTLDPSKLSWDFSSNTSNYAALRGELLAASAGRNWITASAKGGSLLSAVADPRFPGAFEGYSTTADASGNAVAVSTIGELYVRQGLSEGAPGNDACLAAFPQYRDSDDLVVDVCSQAESGAGGAGGTGAGGGAPTCGTTKQGEIDARTFACGSLDDLAVALTGMHPIDVWVTRLESKLPRAALATDLELEASLDQTQIQNLLTAGTATAAPCPLLGAAVVPPPTNGRGEGPRRRRGFGDFAALAAALAALGAMISRRTTRRVRAA